MALEVGVTRPSSMWQSFANPHWVEVVGTRIAELARVAGFDGWDGAGAVAVTRDAVRAALTVLEETMDVETIAPEFVPTVDGGLQLEWHSAGTDVEIYVEPTGTVSAWGREGSREWELDYFSQGKLAKELSVLTSQRFV